MVALNKLVKEIESLPAEYFQEVMDFIGYLKSKQLNNIPETMLFSEKSLALYWNTPEEDELWEDL